MIERAVFAEGLSRIGVATRVEVSEAMFNVYHDAIGPQTTADEWRHFTRAAVASGRWRFFPTVAELLDGLREHRGERLPEVEASDAYERVLTSGVYTPQGGTSWTYRGVKEACGVATAEAFVAAGGDSAFRSTWDEAKRRERFVRAYASATRNDPATRLLPAGPRLALTAGDERREPTRGEAGALLRRIAGKAHR